MAFYGFQINYIKLWIIVHNTHIVVSVVLDGI
jgi:hypothetical protein